MSSRSRRLKRQAQLEGQLRYDPEASALAELMRQAQEDYTSGVRTERGISKGLQNVAMAARPKLGKVYAEANQTNRADQLELASDLAGLGAAAAPYKASAAREAAGANRRISESQSTAMRELIDRGIRAKEGEAYAISNLRNQYGASKEKISSRLLDLMRQQGTFEAAAFERLLGEEEGRDIQRSAQEVTKRGQDLSHADRAAALEVRKAAAAKKKGKTKWISRAQQNKHWDRVGNVRQVWQSILNTPDDEGKRPTPELAAQYLIREKGYHAWEINAARELIRSGHVSEGTISAFHRRGIRVPPDWVSPKRRKPSRAKGGRNPAP